jgi:hypothetical protein
MRPTEVEGGVETATGAIHHDDRIDGRRHSLLRPDEQVRRQGDERDKDNSDSPDDYSPPPPRCAPPLAREYSPCFDLELVH